MEAVILTKEQHQQIIDRLDLITTRLDKALKPASERYLDNAEFIQLLKISKRTSQTWRDEGKISFSQVGAKIYYKFSDVELLIQNHYIKSYTKK